MENDREILKELEDKFLERAGSLFNARCMAEDAVEMFSIRERTIREDIVDMVEVCTHCRGRGEIKYEDEFGWSTIDKCEPCKGKGIVLKEVV